MSEWDDIMDERTKRLEDLKKAARLRMLLIFVYCAAVAGAGLGLIAAELAERFQ